MKRTIEKHFLFWARFWSVGTNEMLTAQLIALFFHSKTDEVNTDKREQGGGKKEGEKQEDKDKEEIREGDKKKYIYKSIYKFC